MWYLLGVCAKQACSLTSIEGGGDISAAPRCFIYNNIL